MESITYFIHCAQSWSHLPKLPDDVLDYIFEIEAVPLQYCSECKRNVLQEHWGLLKQTIPFSVTQDDSFYCLPCMFPNHPVEEN